MAQVFAVKIAEVGDCSGLGAVPQAVRMYDKARQQRHGRFIR